MDVPFKVLSLGEIEQLLDISLPLMYDCETIGLYGKIRLAQFYQKGMSHALLVENPDPMMLVSLLSKYHFVCHNAHYDISCVQENVGKMAWVPEKYSCTFLLARLKFYMKQEFSLDNVITYVTNIDVYEGEKKALQGSDWSAPVLSEAQLKYAASDVIYLQDVYDYVKDYEEDINYRLDILMSKYCLDFQNNGMPVDMEAIDARYVKNQNRITEIGLSINCNSYQQVRKYIDSNQSDDLGLARLSLEGNERAMEVRETRKLTKNNSFLTKFKNTADIEDCIYGKFKVSARSGRTTSDDQNLQQIPRNLKGVFGVRAEENTVLLYADYPQIQLRGVCVVTGDETMETLFRAGEDLHNYVAKMIFGPDFTKKQRQICKTANFGLLFGAGIETFRSILLKDAGLLLTEDEAKHVKAKWLSLWRSIAKWQNDGIKAWKRGEAWETPLGRRYTAKLLTDQLAMQIQGFEAEVTKLATHYMTPKLKELHKSIKQRNFIHDSYIFSCDNDEAIYMPACQIIGECMQEAWTEMSKSVKIKDLPMPSQVRVGYNWGDIEDGNFIYELNI